jgi:signal transduction histidine kinase
MSDRLGRRIARTPDSGVALALHEPSLRELTDSRARLFGAADRERRRRERDLHDGAQQRLMGIQAKLRLAQQRLEDEALEDEGIGRCAGTVEAAIRGSVPVGEDAP